MWQPHAQLTVSTVAMTSISATAVYSTTDAVPLDWQRVALVMSGALIGVQAGARVMGKLDGNRLRRLFAVALMCLGPAVPLGHYTTTVHTTTAKQSLSEHDSPSSPSLTTSALTCSVGIVAGTLSGLLGVGGGTVVTPCLALLSDSKSQPEIIAVSLAAMVIPSMLGAFQHFRTGNVLLHAGIPLGVGALAGGIVGSLQVMKTGDAELRYLLGIVLFCSGLKSWMQA